MLEVPGIGLISLSNSAGFGSADTKLHRLHPETKIIFYVTPRRFLYKALPRKNSVAYIFGLIF